MAAAPALASPIAAGVPKKVEFVPGEILVKFKPSATRGGAGGHRKHLLNGRLKANFTRVQVEHWELPAGGDVLAEIERLKASGEVEFAEPNYRRYPVLLPNDYPQYPGGTFNYWTKIQLPLAWDNTQGSGDVIVAVIDDAIDIDHRDLRDNIWTNPKETINTVDDDGNGFVDDVHGWAFANGYGVGRGSNDVTPDTTACPQDAQDHGTQVAGIIGAVGNNSTDIAGVNWHVTIMPLKLGCNFSVANEVAAINYALANGASIINASFAGPGYSMAEFEAVAALQNALSGKDILFVAAAGNTHGDNDIVPMYPASLALPNVISVAASDGADMLTPWTHYGATSVDLAAPGVGVQTLSVNNGTKQASGTSMSTPIVAGVTALLKAAYPDKTSADIKGAILASVDPLNNARDRTATGGRVNAYEAWKTLGSVAKPVLVINKLNLQDANANGIWEAGESTALEVVVENVWASATGVQAVLSNGDLAASVIEGSRSYGNIAAGATASATFSVKLSNAAAAFRRVPFTLAMSTAGLTYTRHFYIETGPLTASQAVSGNLQQDEFDEFHTYHINVPAGASDLVVDLDYATAKGGDVGLLMKHAALPQWLFDNDGGFGHDQTQVADGVSGHERLVMANAPAGSYHITLVNAPASSAGNELNVPYTLRACYNTALNNPAPTVQLQGAERRTVHAGERVSILGQATDDGAVASLWWDQIPGYGTGRVSVSATANPATKTASLNFTAPSTGEITFILNATDEHCAKGSAAIVVAVKNDQAKDPAAPVFNNLESRYSIRAGENLNFSVFARDPNNDTVGIAVVNSPQGASFEPATGLFYWPSAAPVGEYSVTFVARDATGLTTEQVVTISVITSDYNGSAVRVAQTGGAFDALFLIFAVAVYRRRVVILRSTPLSLFVRGSG